ncbi:MAG TPA: hypothetical protein VFK02_13795 [Kofleriaceae bacterium]|nr:hypothetical protein [Kofleriaceae bacterium]
MLLVACNAPFIAGCFGSSDDKGGTTDPACQLDSQGEQTPGFPFAVDKFGSDVLPILAAKCGTAGCHAAPTGQGNFTIWPNAKPGDCDFGKTFNQVAGKIDLNKVTNSPLLSAVNGGDPAHPFKLDATAPELATLTAFIQAGSDNLKANGGGGVTAGPGASPFDATVYQSTIQPMLEICTASGCHGTGAGGFTLKPMPAAGSADFTANFTSVTGLTNLTDPSKSLIYTQATTVHAGNPVINATQAAAMLDWITKAKTAAGSNPGTANNCAPLDKFNVGTFGSQIVPILSGALDLNQPDGRGRGAGCMSTACHGTDRGPGTLQLLPTADSTTLLQNFACFVNLAAPSSSEILACPTNSPGCRKQPHPGQDVLDGANDLNYQAILAFIFGTKTDVTPLDFAFFVRNINPIFDDVNSVQNGALGISCSDATQCHGITVAGQAPPNGSDFPILTNASGFDALTFNFVSAAGFTNFLNPGESSLFLYPTNEIANRADHPFATGLDHPGGLDFAPDSTQALAITQWAHGLRPDGQGFQRNWLVVGDFPATLISDQTIINETTVTPQIFDRGGGSFNVGEWDGLFSGSANVDLNTVFPRNATSGRIGYAVAYAINTVPRQIQATLTVTSVDPVRIYVDGVLAGLNDQGNGSATAVVNFAAAGSKTKPSRILLKVLQRANDAQFAFTAQLRDQQGQLLTDVTGELVFTLGLNGGI